jgi:hypothetical protein
MARFRAYASDSSSDEEELQRAGTSSASERLPDQQGRDEQHESESDEESLNNSGESSGSSSSDMDEEELIAPRTLKSANSRGHNALVEDQDGEIRYAHEVDVRVSPPSARSSPPSNPRQHVNGNPTIIPWAQQIGVDAQKMHVMQTSLFRMPEAAALRALDQPTRPQQTTRQNLALPAQSLNRKHSRDSDGDGLRFDSREVCLFLHSRVPFDTSQACARIIAGLIRSRHRTTSIPPITKICSRRNKLLHREWQRRHLRRCRSCYGSLFPRRLGAWWDTSTFRQHLRSIVYVVSDLSSLDDARL